MRVAPGKKSLGLCAQEDRVVRERERESEREKERDREREREREDKGSKRSRENRGYTVKRV